MASGSYTTKKVRQNNDWQAPHGPLTASAPGLLFWKPEFKEPMNCPHMASKPPGGLKTDPKIENSIRHRYYEFIITSI